METAMTIDPTLTGDEEVGPVRGGSLLDMADDLRPAAESGDPCMVDARSVHDALLAAHAEIERLRRVIQQMPE